MEMGETMMYYRGEWLGVCPHEDCPYDVPEGDADCGNHEEWMT